MRFACLFVFLMAAAALAGCNSNSGTVPAPPNAPGPASSPGTLITTMTVPGLTTGGPFTYDIGATDSAASRYFLADRTNASLDVFDTANSQIIAQVKDNFTGQQPQNSQSGPDGVVIANGNVYVGDVNNVKVINESSLSPVTTVTTGTTGFRTDEGCYDPADGLVMFANPNDTPPYVTWISTSTNTVTTTLTFNGSGAVPTSTGLEACVYDPGTKNFLINNDGSTANPAGEIDVIPASSVVAKAPTVSAAYPLGQCGPTGMALGNNETLFIGCDPANGQPEIELFVNATNGSIIKTVTTTGGADEVWFDSKLNRYYCACRNWTSTGIAGGGTNTPVLGIVDGSTMNLIVNAPTGKGSHSVAVDENAGKVFVPVPPTSSSSGGIAVFAP